MNWYIRASKEIKPFGIMVYIHGEEYVPDEMKSVRIDAYSAEQARKFFLDRYSSLRDYLEMGYGVEVWFDKELMEQRKKKLEMEIKRKEEQIQNAWWNQ